MATLTLAPAPTLTYEAYLAEPEVQGRYDIVNGVRIFMVGASWRHQRISRHIEKALDRFEESTGLGLNVHAPFDVLIRRFPKMQTRQPDVLFISYNRLAQGYGIPAVGPLETAPELVVEIISDSETQRILEEKLADYCEIGVSECWVVRPETRTVEVLALSAGEIRCVAVYTETQAVASVVFEKLSMAVADIFAE